MRRAATAADPHCSASRTKDCTSNGGLVDKRSLPLADQSLDGIMAVAKPRWAQ